MKGTQSYFLTAQKDFHLLKDNKQLPPQMQIKLEYLLYKIEGKNQPKFHENNLPEYEKNSLDSLNKETGINLFCNIVNCLSGKEVILYFRDEKVFLRKDGILSSWKQIYITCDSSSISLRKKIGEKPTEVLMIQNLRISKNYRAYKKKFVFATIYKTQQRSKEFLIGFDLQSSCQRTHQLIRSLIRQKQKNKNIQNVSKTQMQKSQTFSQIAFSSNIKSQVVQSSQQELQYQEEGEVDENSDKGVVINFIREVQNTGDNMYKLHKAQGNVRYLIHKNYPNKIKVEVVIQSTKNPSFIFDCFLKMEEWNSEIECSKVKIKLADNSYMLQLRVKKYSYLSWPRSSVLLATGLAYDGKYFLVIRSTGEDCQYSDTVKMDYNQIVQVCESKDKVLVTFVSEFDFKGYSSLQDSQRMALRVLQHLPQFFQYHETKLINTKSNSLFNFSTNTEKIRKIKKMVSNNIESTKKQFSKIDDSEIKSLPDERQIKSSITPFDMNEPEGKSEKISNVSGSVIQKDLAHNKTNPLNFIKYMAKDPYSEIFPELIQLIKQKAFEKYYLHELFDQQVYVDPQRNEVSVEGPDHYIFQNKTWKLNEDGDLVFINQKILDIQGDVIKMVIKQLTSNIMSGKSIMNMSLPVEIFDDRSILERVAIGFGYAPKFLIPASQTNDLLEQAKFVTLFFLGMGTMNLTLTKPFNPILGETFECLLGGIPIYLQQISHHPPISAFYMKNDDFIFHGIVHSHAQMGLNRVTGRNLNTVFVKFPKTNTCYEVKIPEMEANGLVHGQKKYRQIGKGFIHERTNNLFVEWSVGKDKKKVYQSQTKMKPNDICGGIFTVSDGFGKKFIQCENKLKMSGIQPDDIVEKHVAISGNWCFDVYFNKQQVKSIKSPIPNKLYYPNITLPSDSNFRLDVLYKRIGNLKAANEQKQVLQNIQRHDRKLREGKIKAK